MKIGQAIPESREQPVFVLKHDTVNLSFMYTDLSTEVRCDGFINIIMVFAWLAGLAKEAAGIDEQKKQFQRTGLNTVICSIENGKICAVYIQELRRFMNDKLANIGIPAPAFTSESFVRSWKVSLRCFCIVCISIGY